LGIGRGLRLDIDFTHQTRLYLGLYETELNAHLRRLCRPGLSTFDIGGQSGYDALVMAKLTGSRVVSIDCDPAAIEQMTRNFAANAQLAPKLVARQALIAARTDTVVGALTLDDLAEETFVPDMMKIDIEGAEVDALEGGRRILEEHRPGLIIEVHGVPQEESCVQLLGAFGYQPVVVNQRRLFADYRPISHNRWLVADPPALN
jgi:hypothetical protein